jgi:hypothetical protein
VHLAAELLDTPTKHLAGRLADVRGQQMRRGLHEVDLQTTYAQRPGHLQAEQPTTDDHGTAGPGQSAHQSDTVRHRPKGVHLRGQVAVRGHEPPDRRQDRN